VKITTKPGRFITVEGIEGVGKSTHLAAIEATLKSHGIDVTMSREPGGTPLGEVLRGVLLDHRNTAMTSDTELLLMFAARAQHLQEKILPTLQAGGWVVSDRFTDATYAYQGGGRGISLSRISALEDWVQGSLRPDMTIILDAPVEIALQRMQTRGALDRFEREQAEFFQRVRDVYLARAAQMPERYVIIDASPALETVRDAVIHCCEALIQRWS
jgi:dTMP kinase